MEENIINRLEKEFPGNTIQIKNQNNSRTLIINNIPLYIDWKNTLAVASDMSMEDVVFETIKEIIELYLDSVKC